MNLPNKLTIFRIFLVPVIVGIMIFPFAQFGIALPLYQVGNVFVSGKNIIVLIIFIIASITDFLDGFIARKYKLITTFGKFLDPIADKLLINTLFIILATQGSVRVVPVIVMIWRDTLVDGMRMVASQRNVVMSAGMLGKVKTVSQMITIILVLINNLPFELLQFPVATFMVWFSMIVSIFGGISYFMQVKHLIFESK